MHKRFFGSVVVGSRFNRSMDTNHNEARADTQTPLRQDMVSAIDDHWDDGPRRTYSQVKSPGFERLNSAIRTSAALGEDDHRHALGNLLSGRQEALVSRLPVGPVDADIANPSHGEPENWNLKKFLLGQPPKLNREISQEG